MQLAWVTLVVRLGPKAGDAAAFVVGVERQVQANGIVDAAHETQARVGLFFHVLSPCAACIIASISGTGKRLPFESRWALRWEVDRELSCCQKARSVV